MASVAIGSKVFVADHLQVIECTVKAVFDEVNASDPTYELVPRYLVWEPYYFKKFGEFFLTKESALEEAIEQVQAALSKDEVALLTVKGDMRWHKRNLKRLQEDLEKEKNK